MDVVREAVCLYRQLAVERPAVCGRSLARSLDDLSRHLFDLGRLEEALDVTREAVEWYRQLATDLPVIVNADLVGSLNSMSCYLSDLGLTAEALDRKREAAKIQVSPSIPSTLKLWDHTT